MDSAVLSSAVDNVFQWSAQAAALTDLYYEVWRSEEEGVRKFFKCQLIHVRS